MKPYNKETFSQKPFIFFDIGSTLMDGPDLSPASRFIEELDLSPADKEVINSFIFTENIADPEHLIFRFRELFPHLPENTGKKIRNIWHAQMSEGFAIEGAMETLTSLSERGYRMGIISNIWHPYYVCFEKLFAPIMDKFERIILSYRTGCRKPDEKIFRIALSSLSDKPGLYGDLFYGEKAKTIDASCETEEFPDYAKNPIDPSFAAIVGDSYYHDIEPAIKIGMKTIWVLREYKREAVYMRDILTDRIRRPDVVVREIGELAGIEVGR